MIRRETPTAGFTLVELVIALTIMTVLVGGMASAVLIASHALPDNDDPAQRQATAVAVVDQIGRDLALATTFVLADSDTARFAVPDRGHGAAGAETMRYAWSGTPGDPLTHRYNGSPDIELCEDVHAFSLEYVRQAKPLQHAPRVLLVVWDPYHLNAEEAAKQKLMQDWGFSVESIMDGASQADYDARLPGIDLWYICESVGSAYMTDKDLNPSIGIVTEESYLYDELRISQGNHTNYGNDDFWIVDDTHDITAGLGTGETPIFDFYQRHTYASGTLAPGAHVLSQWPGYDPTTVVIEAGDQLYGGETARGRRVALPWGDSSFDVTALTDEGRQIMQNSILWAASPVGIGSVRITLQISSDPGGRVETQVQLLNVPEVQ